MTDSHAHVMYLRIRDIYESQIDDKCLRRLNAILTYHIRSKLRYQVEEYLLEEFS